MIPQIIFFFVLAGGLGWAIDLLIKIRDNPPEQQKIVIPDRTEEIKRDIVSEVRGLAHEIETLKKNVVDIPRTTLKTFEGNNNVSRGEIAEWAALQKLSSVYDVVIPFNAIFDFMCILFPKDDKEGSVDFIDVKSGKAVLSAEQKKLRDLIKAKKIDFKTVKVQVEA